MTLWIVFAVMAAAAVAAVLSPLVRSRMRSAAGDDREHEVEVYRDQLAEIDRDLARQLISEQEAESARAEIARRLIAANESGGDHAPKRAATGHRLAALLVVVSVLAITLGGYLTVGSPDLPSQPFAERQAEPLENQDLATLVGRVERHLQENPTDAAGWDAIGPAYMRLRRFSDAADAFTRAIRFGGETAARLSALGEARLFATGGMIDAQAREAFERASALDPDLSSPRYYLGLAAVQDGDLAKARTIWGALLETAPPDAAWTAEVRRQLAALGQVGEAEETPAGEGDAAQPGPTADDIAAAEALTDEERGAMIEGMVEGLAARLEDDPDDLDGWLRLARSYVVLKRPEDARAALESAREAFTGQDESLQQIDDLARELGLDS